MGLIWEPCAAELWRMRLTVCPQVQKNGTTTFRQLITLSGQEGKTQVMAEAVPGVAQEECWVGAILSLLPLSFLLGVNHNKKKYVLLTWPL